MKRNILSLTIGTVIIASSLFVTVAATVTKIFTTTIDNTSFNTVTVDGKEYIDKNQARNYINKLNGKTPQKTTGSITLKSKAVTTPRALTVDEKTSLENYILDNFQIKGQKYTLHWSYPAINKELIFSLRFKDKVQYSQITIDDNQEMLDKGKKIYNYIKSKYSNSFVQFGLFYYNNSYNMCLCQFTDTRDKDNRNIYSGQIFKDKFQVKVIE